MRFPFLIILVVTLILSGGYWYKTTANICPVPFSYRLGDIAQDFGISEEEARAVLSKAEAVWEEPMGRELFVYDESSNFPVNFIFDERQELANTETNQRSDLDAKKAQSDELLSIIEDLQADYDELTFAYQGKTATYESRLNAYNETVQRYNDQGGAPADAFAELEKERNELNRQLVELNSSADALASMVAKINELSDRGNILVSEYNREVENYNREFGHSREFTQGDYEGDSINIYKFANERELIAVLAHEFGHALGIGHVEGTSSLMYYLLEDTEVPPTLSVEDSGAFMETCGTGNEISFKIRATIRNILSIFI